MCYPSLPCETSEKDNLKAVFTKLPEIIGSRKTKEERIAFLNNLGAGLDHSLEKGFTKSAFYASLRDLAASDYFNQQDFFWSMVIVLSNTNIAKLPVLSSDLVEERLAPNMDVEKLRQYLTCAAQLKSSSTSGLLRILSKIEKCGLCHPINNSSC